MSLSDISTKFTEEVLNEIIRKAGGVKHTDYKFGKGFKKGDSYLSKVFRLCVYGVDEANREKLEINLIVKSMPDNAARRKLFRSADFFRNEINFYTKIIPAWEKFQKQQNPKQTFKDYPLCYACFSDGENDFIALEDVSIFGFVAPNRQEYISLEECVLIMKTLGRFHGLSLAFNAIDPFGFKAATDALEETYYSEKNRKWYIEFLNLACEVAKDAVSKTYPGSNYEAIASNFLKAENLYDDLIHLVSSQSTLSVVGHGDCWTPNFLTRYSENGLPDAITIIDFQLARRSSLVIDLSFFIYSCTSQNLREQHFDEILKAYHQSALSIISDLGVDAEKLFSWNSLLDELQKFGRFGCAMGIESLPMSLIEDEEVANLDGIQENNVLTDVWNIKPFQEKRKQERIAQIFKHAIDKGYIK